MTVRRSGFIITVATMLLTSCAHTATAPQAATAAQSTTPSTPSSVAASSFSAPGSTPQTPTFPLKSTAQVQPIGPMPADALTQARFLIATWQAIKSSTDPTLPHDLFGEPTPVTANGAHLNADGTLTYYWNAFSAGPTEPCGSYFFPSFVETADTVVVYIAAQLGPNASASDGCAADAKAYSVRLPLRTPLAHRVVIDVGLGTVVPVN